MDPSVTRKGGSTVAVGWAGHGVGKGIVERHIELAPNVVGQSTNGQTLGRRVNFPCRRQARACSARPRDSRCGHRAKGYQSGCRSCAVHGSS